MSYIISKHDDDLKLNYYKVSIEGLDVTPTGIKAKNVKASGVTISDDDLKSTYIKKKINSKLDKLVFSMIRILNDEDTNSSDAGRVLDEVSRLKGIIFTKYKEYMTREEYKSLLSKLILLEEQFKKNYNQKIFMENMRSSIMYEDTMKSGRGM